MSGPTRPRGGSRPSQRADWLGRALSVIHLQAEVVLQIVDTEGEDQDVDRLVRIEAGEEETPPVHAARCAVLCSAEGNGGVVSVRHNR